MLVIILPNSALIVFSCPSLGEIHDLVPAQDRVGAFHQYFQDIKLCGGQINGFPVDLNCVGRPVQYHVAAPDEKRFSKVLGGQNILAPENGLDSGQKFPWVKRLGQVVICNQILAWANDVKSTPLKKQYTATQLAIVLPMRYPFFSALIFFFLRAIRIKTLINPNKNLANTKSAGSICNHLILAHLIIIVAR